MTGTVKGVSDRRVRRRVDTEERIVAAATELFLAEGYAGTTLSAVAAAADVADRTVYVRFGTKAELLKRAVDVAIVGDTAPLAVAERDWAVRAMTAATLGERLAVMARGSRELLERAGPLFAVAQQAEAAEPIVAAAAQAGRAATAASFRRFWERLRADGLMNPAADLEWVIPTSVLLGSADTYVQMTRVIGWTPDEYEKWMLRTWTYLAAGAGPATG